MAGSVLPLHRACVVASARSYCDHSLTPVKKQSSKNQCAAFAIFDNLRTHNLVKQDLQYSLMQPILRYCFWRIAGGRGAIRAGMGSRITSPEDNVSAAHFPKRILFPPCGKAVDMQRLALAGHKVVGCDCVCQADDLIAETKGAVVAGETTAKPLKVVDIAVPASVADK